MWQFEEVGQVQRSRFQTNRGKMLGIRYPYLGIIISLGMYEAVYDGPVVQAARSQRGRVIDQHAPVEYQPNTTLRCQFSRKVAPTNNKTIISILGGYDNTTLITTRPTYTCYKSTNKISIFFYFSHRTGHYF